ncbi:unnamed protein product [Brassicogethes aeneus]|uniref:Calponin-homology (CH) domain-containing protein n=1 Tax=Brassicogethes aeneus TaxID=1431903 RepID=A0A9P0BF48_BRAAE|nr:unnamed protein product [Brassicogethes aeneus]
MTEIIVNWIQERLGVIINTEPESLTNYVRDGGIITRLLLSYMIISQEEANKVLLVDHSDQSKLHNFNYIKNWLKNIDIYLTNAEVENIVCGNNYEAMHLMYQIYLELKDLTFLNICTKKKIREKYRPQTNTLEVTTVPESELDKFKLRNHKSSHLIPENYDVIHWHRDRLDILLQKCQDARENYFELMHENCERTVLDNTSYESALSSASECVEVESMHESFCDLIKQKLKSEKIKPIVPDIIVAQNIVKKYKKKHKEASENTQLKKIMESMALSKLKGDLEENSKKNDASIIDEKLLQQSVYEKKLTQMIADVKLQKDMIIKNKQLVNTGLQEKRDKNFIDNLVMYDKNVNENKLEYYIEKERNYNLHRRIYDYRQKIKAERVYNMCLDAVKDMVDIAIALGEHKERYGEEAPKRVVDKYKCLFVKEKPIFDIITPVERIIRCGEDEEEDFEYIQMEIERQDALDECEFENYQNYINPFEYDQITFGNDETDYKLACGTNIIANIIYTLLTIKYPKNTYLKPNLDHLKIAACINGLTDTSTLPVLQKLLEIKEVKVLEFNDVVNFCLEAHNEETMAEYPDTILIEETDKEVEKIAGKGKGKKKKGDKKKKNKKDKKKKKDKKSKKSKKSSPSSTDGEALPEEPKFFEKIIQTPKIFPGEEIKLTSQAELGKIADEQLHLGEKLTDYFLTKMLIVYLENHKDIQGFVLVNYPTDFEKAALLEESLTGVPVPGLNRNKYKFQKSINELGDFEFRLDDLPDDPNEQYRYSKLYENPVEEIIPPIYDTFLTAYIKMILTEPDEETGEIELPPAYEALENCPDPMDQFYADLGCNYSMYYKKLDINAIKYLGKLIIGEYTIPPKTSIELFGDTVTFIEAEFGSSPGGKNKSSKKGDKVKKPKEKKAKSKEETKSKKDKGSKKNKGSKKDKGSKKSKKSKDKSSKKSKKGKKGKKGKGGEEKVIIVHEDKATQMPEEEEEEPPPEEPIPPKAGEKGWVYASINIPRELGACFATIWENTEEVYIEDFKQLFFTKRLLLDLIAPYTQYIKDHMAEYIHRPDNKQHHVSEFQRIYNDFDMDFRTDEEFKAEIHLRIKELKESLYDICDEIMTCSESERQKLIFDNWVPKQAIEFCNIYVNTFQLEIDRCVDSMQIINDYYTSMVTKMPTEKILQKTIITKLSSSKDIDEQPNITNQFIETFTNIESDLQETVFHTMLQEKLTNALSLVEATNKDARSLMEKIKSLFKPKKAAKNKSPRKGKSKGGKKSGKSSKKSGKSSKKSGKSSKKSGKSSKKSGKSSKGKPGKVEKINILTIFEPEQTVIDNYDRITQEWDRALEGELLRVQIRLNLLKAEGCSKLEGILGATRSTFHQVYQDIKERYYRETEAVDTVWKIFSRAVEEEQPIQEELILDGEEVCMKPLHLLFPDPVIIPEPYQEELDENIFSFDQLDRLVMIMFDIGPSGYIVERSFCYLIQDMITCSPEDDSVLVPILWSYLKPCDIDKMSKLIFDPIEYVPWKDFVILNFMVGFPTIEELVQLRYEYRELDPDANEYIYDYQFYSVKLWFESENDKKPLRSRGIKDIIYKLYRIKGDRLNYTAFLLDISKDENITVGFSKALSVCMGKVVCWSKTIGEKFIKIALENREQHELEVKERDLEIEENYKMADEIVTELIDITVHQCDSVVIEDYDSQTSQSILDLNLVPDSALPIAEKIEEYIRQTMKQHNPCEDTFSNVAIGFEDKMVPNFAYFLPFEVLLSAITMTLPWNAKVRNVDDESFRELIENIYEKCKNPEFSDKVLCHEFLFCDDFQDLFKDVKRFLYRNPVQMVKELISEHEE